MFATPSKIPRILAATATVALIAAACSKGTTTAAGGAPSPSMSGGEMMMQPGADKMHAKIVSPSSGFVLTGNTLNLLVQTSGYRDTCDWAGKQDEKGIGHYHVLLDGSLINMLCMSCTQTFRGTTVGLPPGTTHTLFALLTDNGHAPLDVFDQIEFTVGS